MARGLTKAAIVQAALDLLDDAGLEGLTLRAVAARLGVRAPALYWHVASKQALLDEMGTEIWRQIEAELSLLPAELTLVEGLAAYAAVTRRHLLAHRDGARTFPGTYLTDARLLEAQEEGLARMVAQGLSLAEVVRAFSALHSFTVGFCIEEQAVAQAVAAGDERYSLSRRAERIDPRTHPLVARSGPEIFGDPGQRFADLVQLISRAVAGRAGSGSHPLARGTCREGG